MGRGPVHKFLMISEFVSTLIGLEVFGPQKHNFKFKFGPQFNHFHLGEELRPSKTSIQPLTVLNLLPPSHII